MEQSTELARVALATFISRITSILPKQIRSCLEELTEEQLWWRPNEESNSVGNLVLHVSGSMRHYLCLSIGGLDYARDRDKEFSERGPMPKSELLSIFDETINQASQVLKQFDISRFTKQTEEPNYYSSVFEQIFGVATHLAAHTGQIVYITKMLKEGSLDELWIQAHKR